MTNDDTPVLTSWKEIAQHLQVTVRTAQLWEKQRGLPVRRVPGRRGRVFLRVDELEAWLAGRGNSGNGDERSEVRPWHSRLPTWAMLTLVVGTLGVLVGLFVAPLIWNSEPLGPDPSGPPVAWRVVGDALIITDEAGVELWRKSFPDGLTAKHYEMERGKPTLEDIDSDGTVEVLFVQRPTDSNARFVLICYAEDGTERWRYEPSRLLATAEESFENIFRVSYVKVARLGPGPKTIIVASHHYHSYPSLIALLSPDGELVADYWHAGHIGQTERHLAVADLDQDGHSSIYAAGVNNAREQATLVVLDPATMSGAGVESDPDYQFQGFAPGQEIARVFFPRTSLNEYLKRYNVASSLLLSPDSITVGVNESAKEPQPPLVHYRLGPDLSLLDISLSDTFIGAHGRLVQDGVLSLTPAEEERILMERGIEVVRPSAPPIR